MRRTKTMILTGKLEELEERLVIENDLIGLGWKIEDFKIIAYQMDEAQDNTYVARLATQPTLDPLSAQFELPTVLGFATYGGGANDQLLDMATVITDELYVTNCTATSSITQKEINYQIILGQYDITDLESIVAQVKNSQGNPDN